MYLYLVSFLLSVWQNKFFGSLLLGSAIKYDIIIIIPHSLFGIGYWNAYITCVMGVA